MGENRDDPRSRSGVGTMVGRPPVAGGLPAGNGQGPAHGSAQELAQEPAHGSGHEPAQGLQRLLATRPRRGLAVWQAQVLTRAADLQVEASYAEREDPAAAALVADVHRLLAEASALARGKEGLRAWWTGASVEMAWRYLHIAEHNLYAVQGRDVVAGRIPEVAASAQSYLGRTDPVATAFASWHERWQGQDDHPPVTGDDRHLLRSVVDAAHRASSTQIAKVRSFRNVLVLASLLLVAALAAVLALGWWRPELIPLCGQGEEGLVCPPLGEPDPSSWGVVQVLLFGAFGGAVAGVFSISHQRGTRVPYQVPVVQALLKVPAGAATALVGIVLLQSNLAPGLAALSATAVAGYAMLFGYAQQLLTTFVDRRAGEVLAPAQPRSDEGKDDPA